MINNLGSIPNPNNVFEGINDEQIRAVKNDIFVGNLFDGDNIFDETFESLKHAIITRGENVNFSEKQIGRLMAIANMLRDKENNKGQLNSFRIFFNSVIAITPGVPDEYSETPSANIVEEQKRKAYLALQEKNQKKYRQGQDRLAKKTSPKKPKK